MTVGIGPMLALARRRRPARDGRLGSMALGGPRTRLLPGACWVVLRLILHRCVPQHQANDGWTWTLSQAGA
jgi:hypothetical protein